MTYIKRCALVSYSTEKMFSLVNDISAYPEFIPGCISMRIIQQNNSELIAKMNISKAGVNTSLTTHNIFIKNHSIIINSLDGPFSFFKGSWHFFSLEAEVSKIEFNLNFKFKNKIIELLFERVFNEIANNMVIIFTSRAKQIYNV